MPIPDGHAVWISSRSLLQCNISGQAYQMGAQANEEYHGVLCNNEKSAASAHIKWNDPESGP